jgi:transcriptional regulator with XRE-family HTH domain
MGTKDIRAEVIRILDEGYETFCKSRNVRRSKLVDYARWLGVAANSLTMYMSGERTPGLESAYNISKRLGPEILDVLDFPRVAIVKDDRVQRVIANWPLLSDEAKKEILGIIENETDGFGRKGM